MFMFVNLEGLIFFKRDEYLMSGSGWQELLMAEKLEITFFIDVFLGMWLLLALT